MLHVEIKTWDYQGGRFTVRAYADHERKLYGLDICTAGPFVDKNAARRAAVEWLNREHSGQWREIA